MEYLDEWNAVQREAVASWRRKNTQLREALGMVIVRTSSRNGELSIVVDADARVTDVRLTPQALRLGDVQLSNLLRDTIQKAQAEVAQRVEEVARPFTDDRDSVAARKFVDELLNDDCGPR
ncbi:YbaB/EbfC family nucleoid-associated protein [Prescottella agglutinans]|jgi:DNA-binding protein YbaB|uniref:DNA-binding protein YbaB n=1 Tax=Prescottella agglutinans TaxID=1644129 RepID=A0ABT6M5T2_9NOCA|nr:YbaB/EbfC family nucleoid-associated protein [Prescottella agglutinans]MDH6279275.1 DNA-binding protein YbaB [Prescottella agglutinans]